MPRDADRCPRCACTRHMHFYDGCHTAVGFICRCPLTPWQINDNTDTTGGTK